MKFSEQMALLAKGFNKKDLEEFKRLEAEELAEKKAAEESLKETPEDDAADEGSQKEEIDYKKLYEDLKAEHDKTVSDLKDIQKAKTKENAAPAADKAIKDTEEVLSDIARSFM